jgi:hypothetical protein
MTKSWRGLHFTGRATIVSEPAAQAQSARRIAVTVRKKA